MVVTFMPVMGSLTNGKVGMQKAYADTVIVSGISGDCKFEIGKRDSDYYLMITGGDNAKMADYSYWDKAPWHVYRERTLKTRPRINFRAV